MYCTYMCLAVLLYAPAGRPVRVLFALDPFPQCHDGLFDTANRAARVEY